MVTEEQLKEAYDHAVTLGLAPEAREAWTEYWGLAEERRQQLAEARRFTGPVTVPADALTEALLQDEVRQEQARAALARMADRLFQLPVQVSPEGMYY